MYGTVPPFDTPVHDEPPTGLENNGDPCGISPRKQNALMQDRPSRSAKANPQFVNVTCPFCSLLCDDLAIRSADGRLRVSANGCPRAADGFEAVARPGSPRIDGRPTDLAAAIARAAALLRKARRPHVAGLAADVGGLRETLALADRFGATVDHLQGEAIARNMAVLQDRGWMTTTLSEVRNRADLIILAGVDAATVAPRFFERAVWNRDNLFGPKPLDRDVVLLGRGLKPPAGAPKGSKVPTVLACDIRRIGEVAGALRALLAGQPLQARTVAGVRTTELEALARRMQAARYGVLVWSAGALDFPHADLAILNLTELVKDLNAGTRFSGLPLGGDQGGLSAMQVCGWQTGYPLRVSFAGGHPEYDPLHHSTARRLADGDADLLVWISSFDPKATPPATDRPTIVLGHPNTRLKNPPAVFIPVGTPGLDHAGQLFRSDGVVALPLKALRNPVAPPVAEILAALQQALG